MKTKYPEKLRKGDKVAVVALSGSDFYKTKKDLEQSEKALKSLGLSVVYGKHLAKGDLPLDTPNLKGRVQDFHWAFEDPTIKAVFLLAGGWHANQVLPEIDWSVVKRNPKIFLGHSDGAVICNAIFNKTGLVTYYGGNYPPLGRNENINYTLAFLKKALFEEANFDLKAPEEYFDVDYSSGKKVLTRLKNDGWWVIQQAIGAGRIVGGNVSCPLLLHGTDYSRSYKNSILFVEQYRGSLADFDRMLEAILQQKGGDRLEALVIGRFQGEANVKKNDLQKILLAKKALQGVPIIANVDFGHTLPRATVPIGGNCLVRATKSETLIRIEEH